MIRPLSKLCGLGVCPSPVIDTLAPLLRQYAAVRAHSVALAADLTGEDQCVQSMPDASPTKWHLAHTTWFFETLVLMPHVNGYQPFDRHYAYLFNSYYETLGPRHPRVQRGLLSRPSIQEVHAYRSHVDEAILTLSPKNIDQIAIDLEALSRSLELGLHHEQQHQELLLTDLLHLFSCNPLLPAYDSSMQHSTHEGAPMQWLSLPGGTVFIGHAEPDSNQGAPEPAGFAFDNETPRHQRLLPPYLLASQLVTCGEYLGFIEAGGYRDPQWWLSDGWATVQARQWAAPAYWLAPGDTRRPSDAWQVFGLGGVQPLQSDAPVANISFFEAAAYAEWAGSRLPTEFEWEAAFGTPGLSQMMGSVWQWTRSGYEPYPGFCPGSGAAREYNGKFMVGQQVLRGASLATPPNHSRKTYRNFFPPAARWQFTGLRLARDIA